MPLGLESLVEQVAEGVEVAQRLGHLHVVDQQVAAVQPVVHEGLAGGGLGLRDLVFVVREDVVLAARVDVEVRAQVLHRHGGTLDVPAGTALAQFGIPVDVPVFRAPGLPEREVAHVVLRVLVLVHAAAGPLLQSLGIQVGQPAVTREAVETEIDGSLDVVGMPALAQAAGSWQPSRGCGPSPPGRPPPLRCSGFAGRRKRTFLWTAVKSSRSISARRESRMVLSSTSVRFITCLHLVAAVLEVAAQQVLEHVGAVVPDVGTVVHRGAAGIHPHFSRLQGPEGVLLARQSCCKTVTCAG